MAGGIARDRGLQIIIWIKVCQIVPDKSASLIPKVFYVNNR